MGIRHWEHLELTDQEQYDKFVEHSVPIQPTALLPANTAVYVQCITGSRRLEGIYDDEVGGIRPLKNKSAPNRDLRLYLDAILNKNITMIAVDGLMGTGKTSTCVQALVDQHLKNVSLPSEKEKSSWHLPQDMHRILIAKPHVCAGGEDYGALPGGLEEKLDPTLSNYIQYFDRYQKDGFEALRDSGYVEILPLGFIRGLDATDMTIIVDEAQNTKELISVATRKAGGSRIFFIGDTSPFQIDARGNTPDNNGLTKIMDLLRGAPYFQYVEMKSPEHVVRSDEVRDVVRRLLDKGGKNPQKWIR